MKRKAKRQQNKSLLPVALIALGTVLVVGVLLWSIAQANRGGNAANAPGNAQNIPFPEVKRVSLADAKAAFDGREAVFLDVRDPDTYSQGHVPGAVNISYALLANRINELDPNAWIITYCT